MKKKHINKPCLSAEATLSSCHQFCFVAKKPSALSWIHHPLQQAYPPATVHGALEGTKAGEGARGGS